MIETVRVMFEQAADAVFSATLFKDEDELHDIWVNYNRHPLQEQEPQGDRRWIETFPILQVRLPSGDGLKQTRSRQTFADSFLP